MTYDYLEAVCDDVKEYIKQELTQEELNADDIEERLNDELWTVDSVTGNASGSYTFSRSEAREFVMADMDTVVEAMKEFCCEPQVITEKFLSEDWEWFDVSARCYVLGQAIAKALEEIKE